VPDSLKRSTDTKVYMTGLEISMQVGAEKGREFPEYFEMLAPSRSKGTQCPERVLLEKVAAPNSFLRVKHWDSELQILFKPGATAVAAVAPGLIVQRAPTACENSSDMLQFTYSEGSKQKFSGRLKE